jgi:hypothetical protein
MFKRLLLAVVVTASAVALLGGGAQALKKKGVTGTYVCQCYDGAGTCTASQHENEITCTKGAGATCSGTCKLSTSSTGATRAQ